MGRTTHPHESRTPAHVLTTVLILALTFSGCAGMQQRFSRTVICSTDNLYRRQRNVWPGGIDGLQVAVLIEEPKREVRRIGVILGYQDADWSENLLWESLRVRAAELGSDGIRLVDRRVVSCRSPGRSEITVNSGGTAWGGAVGPSIHECVQILVEALVWDGEYDCVAERNCRDLRTDAYNVKARVKRRDAKAVREILSRCELSPVATSSVAPGM